MSIDNGIKRLKQKYGDTFDSERSSMYDGQIKFKEAKPVRKTRYH